MSFETRPEGERTDAPERQRQPGAPLAGAAAEALLPPAEPAAAVQHPAAVPALPPATVLALQRTLGNRDVQRLLAGRLQRQTPPPSGGSAPAGGATTLTTGLDASMLEVTGGDLQKSGNVTAKKKGDKISVDAPPVKYEASVTLKAGVTLGSGDNGRIDVGPVQTVLSGERVGIYRKGGDPKGDVTSEEHQSVGQARDAQWDREKGRQVAAVPAPWYSQPSNVSDGIRSTQVTFFDQPGFDFPQQVGDGRLTETRGQDRFNVSIGAKRGGQLIHLKPQHWEVPWNLTIDNQGAGKGGEVTGGLAREGPPTTDGPIAVEQARSWTAFTSVEAAMAASPAVLLENLLPAKANDPTAYSHICEALRRKNPSFTVKVKVEKTASWFGADNIIVFAHGTKAAGKPEIKLNTGQEGSVVFTFNEVFDVAAIDGGTKLTITAQDFGEMFAIFKSDPAMLVVAYPYAPASGTRAAGGGSKYTLSVSF
jgi:hypothetical protein